MKNSVVTIKTSLENMSWLWKLFESSNLHIPKSIRLKRLNYPSGEIKKPRNGGLMVWKSFNLPQFPTWARISDSFSREIILTLRKIIRKRISSPSKIEFKRAKKFSQKFWNLEERNTYISRSHACNIACVNIYKKIIYLKKNTLSVSRPLLIWAEVVGGKSLWPH